MEADPKTPLSVVFCSWVIRLAGRVVPADRRGNWQQEWLAEVWHRWQFLLYAGAWDRREALRLIRTCAGAFRDAMWHLVSHEPIRNRLREWARSPWTLLTALLAALLILGLFTGGFPATRQLVTLGSREDSARLLFIWMHPTIGGRDRGFPRDVAPSWAKHSQLLDGVAPFHIAKEQLAVPAQTKTPPLVLITQPSLFLVLRAKPALGTLAGNANAAEVVLDHNTWKSVFHSSESILGKRVDIGGNWYRIAGVLPADFHFLTRRPMVYLLDPFLNTSQVMVLARAKPGAKKERIDRELTKISEDYDYYMFAGQLRLAFVDRGVWAPLGFFGIAIVLSALLAMAACRIRLRHIRLAIRPENRRTAMRRSLFFLTKVTPALALVFIGSLEVSRSESAVLFASRDPANSPFLVWFYILGTMAVMFWSVADQRARCRVCLQLLCFPVRIGCPGCLLLDWSGTELFCTEGHGVLHVPHLAPSWDEDAERWIALDESWSDLFAHTK